MINGFDMKLTAKLASQYKRSSKEEKGKILNEYCRLTAVSRNTAAKRFNKKIKNPYPRVLLKERIKNSKNQSGPKRKYTTIHRQAIKLCWELAGHVCGEKLHPMLSVYLQQLKQNERLEFCSNGELKQTEKISLGMVKNIIAGFPRTSSRRRYKGNALIYKQVPIMADFGRFAKEKPGYLEVDFVDHSGGNSSGIFAVTGVYIDLFSQWTTRAAGLGKNIDSVGRIDKLTHQRIFHPIIHYHPDNAKPILKILFERMEVEKENKGKQPFRLSRSRPYKKNDNAHVEQKNDDKVRKLVGYYRYDTQQEIDLLNQLYQRADFLDNFFIASAKLRRKIRDNKGRVIRRIHDTPKTPFQRLIGSKHISKRTKQKLDHIYHSLNMLKLRKEMEQILNKLFKIQQEKYKNLQGKELLSNKKVKNGVSRN